MSFCAATWPECGVARFISLLDGPWATLIIRNLLLGPIRFGNLRDSLPGISAHTLTNRLRRFEVHGIVTRTVHPEIPPRVVYALTDVGEALRPVLEAMNTWALTVPTVEESPIPDAEVGRPLAAAGTSQP